MIGRLGVILAALALVAVPAFGIEVDGDISDWEAAWILDDPDDDNVGPDFEITRYGVSVVDGNLNAFVELDRPVSDFAGTGAHCHPGMWIDVDPTVALATNVPTEAAGTDIVVEFGYNAGEGTEGQDLNYWGMGDDAWGVVAGGIPGGESAVLGNVLEFSAPLNGIISTLQLLDDNPNPTVPWTIIIAGEGTANDGGGSWGRDFGATAVDIVPEPSACVLLSLGVFGLLFWRRRR